MLGYGRGVFREERGARGVALAGVLSCTLLLLGAPMAAAGERSLGASVVPADGRLNTPGYNAKVTAVAWPARNNGQEPTPGRRFVRFTLEVTALAQSASPTSPAPALGAALRWDGTSHPLSVTSIDDELQAGAGGPSDSASASYMASVPNDTHDVDLVLSEGTFSQSFDLWTLSRVPPSPAVLYRDPTADQPHRHRGGTDHALAVQSLRRLHQLGRRDAAERHPRLLRAVRHDAVSEPRPGRALGRARRRVPQQPQRPGGLGPLSGWQSAVARQHALLHP